MNKFFNKIIGASLAIAMMVGVGVNVINNESAKPIYATGITRDPKVSIYSMRASADVYNPMSGAHNNMICVGGTIQCRASITYKQGEGYANGNGLVTWSSNNEAVATVDEHGLATLTGNGTVKITAASLEDPGVSAYTSFRVQDIRQDIVGSEKNPYKVSQAIALLDNKDDHTLTNTYVKGVISQIDSYDDEDKTITYWISDDGAKTNQIKVSNGFNLNYDDFNSIDDLKVYAEVIVNGDMIIDGESVHGFGDYSALVSYAIPKVYKWDTATSGKINEGDYLIVDYGKAINTVITSSNRIDYDEIAVINYDAFSSLDRNVWHVAPVGNYYSFYNKAIGKYLAYSGTAGTMALEDSITNNSTWSLARDNGGAFAITNVALENQGSNDKYLRFTDFGFACFGITTGSNLRFYRTDINDVKAEASSIKVITGTEDSNHNVTSAELRFGITIPKLSWKSLNGYSPITQYGVMFVRKTTLKNTYKKESVEEAFKDQSLGENRVATVSTVGTPTEQDDNYIFTAKINITDLEATEVEYCAAPFVVINSKYYFFEEMCESISSLAEYCFGNNISNLSDEALLTLVIE